MRSLTIPVSVETITVGAFFGTFYLETITVASGNLQFKVDNGVLMSLAGDRIIKYPSALPSTTYTLPNDARSIDFYAFQCLRNLQIVEISALITEIAPLAFYGCSSSYAPSLQEINVDVDNLYYASIAHVLFSKDLETLLAYPGNYANDNYSVPEGTKDILGSSFAFSNIKKITFPSTLIRIRAYAFEYATNLESVGEFPKSYSRSYYGGDWSPFFGASKVPSFSVASDNPLLKSLNGVIFSKDGSILYEYPGGDTSTVYSIPSSVDYVDIQAFVNNYLKTLIVPSTVRSLQQAYLRLDSLEFEGNSLLTQMNFGSSPGGFLRIEYCGDENSIITFNAMAQQISVECSITPGPTTQPDNSAADAAAARVAREEQVKAAEVRLEATIARGEIVSTQLLGEVECFGSTNKNIDLINSDIALLTTEQRRSVRIICKIVLKYATVDKVAAGGYFSFPLLVDVGITPARESVARSVAMRALLASTGEQLDTIAKINEVINGSLAAYQEGRDRLGQVLATIRSRSAE